MKDKKIQVAVLGCGNRGYYVVANLLKDSEQKVNIVSVFDPDPNEVERALNHWQMPDAIRSQSMEEAINAPGVQWVMIFSPNVYHKEQILAAFAAGKHVFTEKPLATSIGDCQEIYQAWRKTSLLFATGFVLRYAPIYRKAKELLDSGKFGRILTIEANENIRPDHGGYIMCNWRRLSKFSGPHILEKCCHDLDLINWFCGSLPSKVASFGGREFFKPENRNLEEKYGVKTFKRWRDPKSTETPFTNDTDMMDNQITIAEYRNRIRVTFTATMCNTIPERRMLFHCTEGVIELELYAGKLRCRKLGDEAITLYDIEGDGHGGGDSYIMKELFDCMTNGTLPKCGGSEGLESAVYALALDKAACTNQVIDLEPVWEKLER